VETKSTLATKSTVSATKSTATSCRLHVVADLSPTKLSVWFSATVDFQQSRPCWIQLCRRCVPGFTALVNLVMATSRDLLNVTSEYKCDSSRRVNVLQVYDRTITQLFFRRRSSVYSGWTSWRLVTISCFGLKPAQHVASWRPAPCMHFQVSTFCHSLCVLHVYIPDHDRHMNDNCTNMSLLSTVVIVGLCTTTLRLLYKNKHNLNVTKITNAASKITDNCPSLSETLGRWCKYSRSDYIWLVQGEDECLKQSADTPTERRHAYSRPRDHRQ